jgi:hypothetical protein
MRAALFAVGLSEMLGDAPLFRRERQMPTPSPTLHTSSILTHRAKPREMMIDSTRERRLLSVIA